MISPILIVDDSKVSRLALRRHVERAGYQAIEASSGDQALEIIAQRDIALVTLDVDMPDKNGFETCRDIRQLQASDSRLIANCFVPIIFVTADDTLEGRRKGFEAGASEFILKSEANLVIKNVIEQHLFPSHIYRDMTAVVVQSAKLEAKMIEDALHTLGVRTLCFFDGLTAFNWIAANREFLDLIVLEDELPGMFGVELLLKIRRELGLPELPVMVVNQVTDPRCRLEMFRAGASDFLEKPFLREELLARIASNLKLRYSAKSRAYFIKELERSNQALKDFASVAAHDLKAPLLAIKLGVELLGSEPLSAEGLEIQQRVLSSASRMESLIAGLLEHSRIGGTEAPLEIIDLGEVISETIGDLQSIIEEKGAVIRLGDFPKIRGDRLQIRRLFQNLLGNSLKYQQQGISPQISIITSEFSKCEATGPQKFHKIEIKDNGIGFDPAQSSKLFQLFCRLPTGVEYDGTGIGLATCRSIVERHGGFISCDSRPGQGSSFFVHFPMTLLL